jgi:hypothetical protein
LAEDLLRGSLREGSTIELGLGPNEEVDIEKEKTESRESEYELKKIILGLTKRCDV